MLRASGKMGDSFMRTVSELLALRAELARTRTILERIEAFYEAREASECETTDEAIILSEVFCNYYTCLETFFLRVSRTFENHLDTSAWHRDLLSKMVLSIPTERQAVLSESAHEAAAELLRFRHFKRYYFEFNYDWDRLRLVESKFSKLRLALRCDLLAFDDFLVELVKQLS